MKKIYSSLLTVILIFSLAPSVFADLKIRQKVTMSGQTFETTKMIKGARQRTEQKSGAGAMDFMSQVASIEQCDLRRTVRVNDSKKLYFIEPFAEETTPTPNAPSRPTKTTTRRGGTVTMTYNVTDTGERKTIFGLTARHLKVLMETESSADSCGGASRSKMEIDGWYVDFSADFNCPYDIPETPRGVTEKPDCRDRVIFKGNRGKTGFLLNGTMTMFDENGQAMMTQTTETLEISRSPLAAALFDVPADYRLAADSQELYAMPSMTDMMRQNEQMSENPNQTTPTKSAMKTVGINLNFGADAARINQAEIAAYLQSKLRENNLNARTGAGGTDYVLKVEFKKVKESAAGKIGGIFGKVTGVETKAGKTEIEMTMTLTKGDTTAALKQTRIAQKYDGAVSEAIKAAIDDALEQVLSEIEN